MAVLLSTSAASACANSAGEPGAHGMLWGGPGDGPTWELPPCPHLHQLTRSLQRHLHGVGDLLLLRHAAQVGQPGAPKLLLGDGHLQQSIVRICGDSSHTHSPARSQQCCLSMGRSHRTPPAPRTPVRPSRTPCSPTQMGSFSRSQGKLQPGAAQSAAVRLHCDSVRSCMVGFCPEQNPASATSSTHFLQRYGGTPLSSHAPSQLSPAEQLCSPRSSSPSPPVAAIPASAAEAAAALLASSSCRCLCSSMETRRACRDGGRAALSGEHPRTEQHSTRCRPAPLTRASSGSALGSTPNSKSLAPRPSMAPPSPARMGELMRASARLGPGGTVTKWEPVPSLPFRVLMKAVSLSVLAS